MVVTPENELFRIIVDRICKIYGDNVVSIILYGSTARGEATDESDIDLAIIIKSDDRQMYDQWLDSVVLLNLEYDQLICTSRIEKEKFDTWKNVLPYYQNIEKEGIVLWKAA